MPILSLPSPTPKVSLKLGRRHRTIAERARQMIACLRRWLPAADLTVVGDDATPKEVFEKLTQRRHKIALAVDSAGDLRGILTLKGAMRSAIYPPALDADGRLRIGAAVGISGDAEERVLGGAVLL